MRPISANVGAYSSMRPNSTHVGTYSFTRPISANPRSYSSMRPISTNVRTYSSTRPISINVGTYSSTRPFLSSSGLTPSRSPVQQIFGSYSFFRTRKNCPSIWCHHKFFQLCEDGKILPQYGISKQIFPASQRWKNFAPVWHYLDRYEFPNSSCTYFLIWSKLTAQVSNQLFFTIFSLLKNLPQYGITRINTESKFPLLSPLP